MRRALSSFGLLSLAIFGGACSSAEPTADEAGSDALTADMVCTQAATLPNEPLAEVLRAKGERVQNGTPRIHNYTAWPTYDPRAEPGAYDPEIVAAKADPEKARDNLASRFGGCAPAVKQHLETKKPNVYVYFTGFGGADQNNSLVDEGAILKWINERDEKALIFSVNWGCASSHDSFCKDNAAKLAVSTSSPQYQYMTQRVNAISPAANATVQQILALTEQNQSAYNSALSHGMQLAAMLVDQLLVADEGQGKVGDIHLLGYSMGAHAASQALVQDFVGDGSGYTWSARGACDDGRDACTMAHLKKVKWALSLGLSGWSEALLAYNGFDARGAFSRDRADAAQYRNGGLYRIADSRFNGKANVFNRRMDPTSNSDDTYQRGFGDLLFSDYNHYSHDYAMPLFVDDRFRRALDAFLEAPRVTDNKELGIAFDHAGKVDFDECPSSGLCEASTGYLAHASNRSHETMGIPRTAQVRTTDGVRHADKAAAAAVTFAVAGVEPIALDTMDQEDLRGGVELYFRPQFDPSAAGTHGLFSYGGCEGSPDDLMPQAFVDGGKLRFTMKYLGSDYTAEVPVSRAALAKGKWTHLAFTWELPVVSTADPQLATFAADAQRHQLGIVLAAGLRKPLPTTYGRQEGAGKLRIFANGNAVAEAPLGNAQSARECLSAATVLGNHGYNVNGASYPTFNPYANYSVQTGDVVSLGDNTLGSMCKAYRVRNEKAFFGCAKSRGVNAAGDMDDITLVWGPGRTAYDDVDHRTGAPKLWSIGATYDAKPYTSR